MYLLINILSIFLLPTPNLKAGAAIIGINFNYAVVFLVNIVLHFVSKRLS